MGRMKAQTDKRTFPVEYKIGHSQRRSHRKRERLDWNRHHNFGSRQIGQYFGWV
jgi:hypothetical protein